MMFLSLQKNDTLQEIGSFNLVYKHSLLKRFASKTLKIYLKKAIY